MCNCTKGKGGTKTNTGGTKSGTGTISIGKKVYRPKTR